METTKEFEKIQINDTDSTSFTTSQDPTETNDKSLSLLKNSQLTLIEKQGWLQKRSTHLIKRWQNRYFTLSNKILMYFYEENDENPATPIDFDQVSISLEYLSNKSPEEMILSIVGCKRVFKLRPLKNESLSD